MCDMLKMLLKSCFILINVLVSDSYEQRDGNNLVTEGSSCSYLGLVGICKQVRNCPPALDGLENKARHDLQRCGFTGAEEVVCCPTEGQDRIHVVPTTAFEGLVFSGGDVSNVERGGMKRKCEKMCEKIHSDNNIKPSIAFLIWNGENAKPGQFPHSVALGFENSDAKIEWNCGASLISSRFLLTAAHCFICNGCSDPVKVRLGVIDITDNKSAQDYDVKNATSHPEYNPVSKHNDIGIVELVQDVQMSNLVYPACLYTNADDPKGLQIIGWGQTVSGDQNSKPDILQFAVIEPVPVRECNVTVVKYVQASSKTILNTQICGTTLSDACPGDSGGPLQILQRDGGYSIVGIVSYGVQCGTRVPGIYTRVFPYLDWIEQNVWPD